MAFIASVLAITLLRLAIATGADADPLHALTHDIAAGPLSRALVDAAEQTGWQVVYLSADAPARQSPGARAGLDEHAALLALLTGTDLDFQFLNARTVRIVPRPAAIGSGGSNATAPGRLRRDTAVELARPGPVAEVVVTASHVVRPPPIPPPLIQALPVTIGLCLPDELRGARLHRVKHKLTLDERHSRIPASSIWELGPAARESLELMAQALFARLLVLEHCTAASPMPAGVDGRLLITLDDASVTLPSMLSTDSLPAPQGPFHLDYYMARRASLTFSLSLAGPGDSAPIAWTVTGQGAALRSMAVGQDDVSNALSLALRNSVARAIVDLSRGEGLRGWLDSRGVSAEIIR